MAPDVINLKALELGLGSFFSRFLLLLITRFTDSHWPIAMIEKEFGKRLLFFAAPTGLFSLFTFGCLGYLHRHFPDRASDTSCFIRCVVRG